MGKKALILGGGGAKGAYQIGVWRALRELEESFDIITGSSIGAINGALMAQDTFETADQLWNSIEYDNIFPQEQQRKTDIRSINSLLDMIKFAVNDALPQGSADAAPLEALLQNCIDEDRVRASKTVFGLVTVELPSMRPFTPMIAQIPHGMLYRYLMASAACFPIFSPYEIDGMRYIDGGYYDNLPVNLAIAQGAEDIIAVDLEAVGLIREPKRTDAVKIRRIHSYWDLGAMFAFDKSIFTRNRTFGYYDTLKTYGKLDGFYYTFEKDTFNSSITARRNTAKQLEIRLNALAKSRLAKTITAVEKDDAIDFLVARKSGNAAEKICRAAEIAGLVYGLSPELVYRLAQFDEQLLHLYHVIPQVFPMLELQPAEDVKRILAAVLQSMEPRSMSAAITQLMLKQESHAESVSLLAGLLPREYVAASYMASLLKLSD